MPLSHLSEDHPIPGVQSPDLIADEQLDEAAATLKLYEPVPLEFYEPLSSIIVEESCSGKMIQSWMNTQSIKERSARLSAALRSVFHNTSPPSLFDVLSIGSTLEAWFKTCFDLMQVFSSSSIVVEMAVFLMINEFGTHPNNPPITAKNVFRICVAAIRVAQKIHQDEAVHSSVYGNYFRLASCEVAELETAFLKAIEYKAYINLDQFSMWLDMLPNFPDFDVLLNLPDVASDREGDEGHLVKRVKLCVSDSPGSIPATPGQELTPLAPKL